MKVGYIRVSSIEQSTERQLDGIELDEIFEEKISAKDCQRVELKKCLQFLRRQDTLYVHSICRLARNQKDLLNIVEGLVNKGVVVKFVTENLEFGNVDNPMNNLLLHVLGAVAQFERSLTKQRQLEGIRKAKEKGVRFGKKALSKQKIKKINEKYKEGWSINRISYELKVGTSTVYKYLER